VDSRDNSRVRAITAFSAKANGVSFAIVRPDTPQSAAAEAAATTAGLDNSLVRHDPWLTTTMKIRRREINHLRLFSGERALGEKDAHFAEPERDYRWEVFFAEGFSRSLVTGKGGKSRDAETVFRTQFYDPVS
jgi:hypothetical protein